MVISSNASTAVQLSLFDVTPPAQHAALGPYGGSLPELRQQRQGGPPGSEAPGRSVEQACLLASKPAPQAVLVCVKEKCPHYLLNCF